MSHNQLERLPRAINKLRNLELLDVSHNRLRNITEISCMSRLQTLDISSNSDLSELPTELSTCSALVHIICTEETIQEPPRFVIERGTQAILTYLAGDVGTAIEMDDQLDKQQLHSRQNEQQEEPKRQIVDHNLDVQSKMRNEQLEFDFAEYQLQQAQQQRREQVSFALIQTP